MSPPQRLLWLQISSVTFQSVARSPLLFLQKSAYFIPLGHYDSSSFPLQMMEGDDKAKNKTYHGTNIIRLKMEEGKSAEAR